MDLELRAKRDALEYLWRQGLSGQALLHKNSRLIDDYLAECFAKCPEAQEGMVLTALGGYGRRELFPFSDIDLLLLHTPAAEKRLPAVTEALFYPLWDAGLEVGHGVRTTEACLIDARNDFFFQVSLLDARPLAGSTELFDELKQAFRQQLIEGHRQDFLQNMMYHRLERHSRYGMHSYRLEPNIKESRGGFRDIHAMLWVAQALFSLQNLKEINDAGLLTSREMSDFEQAWNHLVKIRNRLHYLSGRKNDQLFFEHQEEMAKAFKYSNSNGVLGVERFMQDLYRHLQTIATTTDLFFEHVDETLGAARPMTTEQTIEPGITVRAGRLHLTDQELINKRPYLLLRIFSQAARTGLKIHHRSRKLVSANLHLIDDKLRRSKRMAKAFFEILHLADNPGKILATMLDTGLLTAYIPEFNQVHSLAQHDVYHINTVDRHLLQSVSEVKNLFAKETPFANINSPQILLLAALLHDIGKGHRDDHSQRGAELARQIGERLAMAEDEVNCLCFLIEKHLFLTITALRRDLEDEEFIRECAKQIKSPERLAMLYLLSLADAKATGPTAWNDWKDSLLLELSLKITHLLERSELKLPDMSQGVEWLQDRICELVADKKIDLAILPEEYLLNFKPEEVAHHLKLQAELTDQTMAIVEHEDNGPCGSVLVISKDCTGLLSKICGTLVLHGLHVIGAQIFTWKNGVAVDLLNIRPTTDLTYQELNWEKLSEDLNLALKNRLGLTHRLVNKFKTSFRNNEQKGIKTPPRVIIDNNSSTQYTIVEVFANDRPGLLYDITRTLADFEINIHRAKIGSEGDQVVDVFYTLDSFGTKINARDFQEEVTRALLYVAGGNAECGVKTYSLH
ncbi:MAG: [protein-PII] uridylyltransferase [Desulfobulbaceae bacterium]|nr:[protein-PII] uridylyltransferase [Desulfobulbaceae bacterium]HIJ77721.1 [protein-PII] uridylyltransferase [Deltaproteobacteria bacterium]